MLENVLELLRRNDIDGLVMTLEEIIAVFSHYPKPKWLGWENVADYDDMNLPSDFEHPSYGAT